MLKKHAYRAEKQRHLQTTQKTCIFLITSTSKNWFIYWPLNLLPKKIINLHLHQHFNLQLIPQFALARPSAISVIRNSHPDRHYRLDRSTLMDLYDGDKTCATEIARHLDRRSRIRGKSDSPRSNVIYYGIVCAIRSVRNELIVFLNCTKKFNAFLILTQYGDVNANNKAMTFLLGNLSKNYKDHSLINRLNLCIYFHSENS